MGGGGGGGIRRWSCERVCGNDRRINESYIYEARFLPIVLYKINRGAREQSQEPSGSISRGVKATVFAVARKT